MKKIVIPTILAATILVAGMFAMMPVQKASTVHSGLAGVTVIELVDADNDVGDVYTLNCAGDAIITGINVFGAGSVTDNDLTLAAGGEDATAAIVLAAGVNVVWNNNVGIDAAETATLTSGAETDGGDESLTIKITALGGPACTLT
ncbi:MAG: hypothetical protein HMLIMOIP_000475 [Candidatus Nitrosomirales archaeon]|jgi:hypothetical protein